VLTAIVTNAGGQVVAWTPDPTVGAR